MWSVSHLHRQATTTAPARTQHAAPRLAQARIRSEQLDTNERDLIADLFAVLETLVLRNELPAEAHGIYDQAVLLLARR
jgi:hypothetical protein